MQRKHREKKRGNNEKDKDTNTEKSNAKIDKLSWVRHFNILQLIISYHQLGVITYHNWAKDMTRYALFGDQVKKSSRIEHFHAKV